MRMNKCHICGSNEDVCNYSIQNGFVAHCKKQACSEGVIFASKSDVAIALWNLKNPGTSIKRDRAFAQSIIDRYDAARGDVHNDDLFLAIGVDYVAKLREAMNDEH